MEAQVASQEISPLSFNDICDLQIAIGGITDAQIHDFRATLSPDGQAQFDTYNGENKMKVVWFDGLTPAQRTTLEARLKVGPKAHAFGLHEFNTVATKYVTLFDQEPAN